MENNPTTSNGSDTTQSAGQNPALSQIKTLLEQEKFDDAKILLGQYFSQPIDEAEMGQAYLNIAEIYLDIATHFGQQKKELLESAQATLEDLDKKGRSLDDIINLEEIRKKIKGS